MLLLLSICTPGCAVNVAKALVEPGERVAIATGRLVSSRLPLVSDTLEASVCTIATASTVTVVACEATFRSMSMRTVARASSVERLVFGFLKSGCIHSELVISDFDVDKLITSVRVGDRGTLRVGSGVHEITVAMGTRLPDGSFTVPSTVPKVDWA